MKKSNTTPYSKFVVAVMCATLSILLMTSQVSASDTWQQCAEEGDECHLNAGAWAIRFGTADSDGNESWYYYTEYNQSNAFTVSCDNDTFGDSAKGNSKVCQYRSVYDEPGMDYLGCSAPVNGTTQCGYQVASSTQWSQCAKEGDDCSVNTDGLVAIRYGSYDANKWSVRNWSSNGLKVECSNKAWQFDPAKGYDKVCEWAVLPSYAMRAVAFNWQQLDGVCDNCSAPVITTTVGVSISEGSTTTTGFSATLGAQISEQINVGAGIGIAKVSDTLGYQVSASASANWSRAVETNTTASATYSEQFTCEFNGSSDIPNGYNVVVYQFTTASYRIGAGDVDIGNVQDSNFVCLLTPIGSSVVVPACLPNYFDPSDSSGQTCLPGGSLENTAS